MKLCRFQSASGVSLGTVQGDEICDLTSLDPRTFADLDSAYAEARRRGTTVQELVAERMGEARRVAYDERLLKMPVLPKEIWAAGVTYLRSREARETETRMKGLYDYVYDAVRPELFLKDTGLRCRGPGEEVCVRGDSSWTVPEPELTVVFDKDVNVVGYTVGNDVSSRDIEGENPLYLPQAKVYEGSSAIGPVVTTADEIPDPRSLKIGMRILRGGKNAFEGEVSTSKLKRSVNELAQFLSRSNTLVTFTLLMTGTSIVPPDDFTLQDGDVVEIEIERIGVLRNPVRRLPQ